MNILDHISESLETVFGVKILTFFDADADPGIFLTLDPRSGMEKIRIRDKHPGSATLSVSVLDKEQRFEHFHWLKLYGRYPSNPIPYLNKSDN
jgi:hypothetical protein